MAVYRNMRVRIPRDHVVIQRQEGKPAIIRCVVEARYDKEKGYPVAKRITIGHQCPDSKTMMYPTTNFAKVYPELWEKLVREHPELQKKGLAPRKQKKPAGSSLPKQPSDEPGTVPDPII